MNIVQFLSTPVISTQDVDIFWGPDCGHKRESLHSLLMRVVLEKYKDQNAMKKITEIVELSAFLDESSSFHSEVSVVKNTEEFVDILLANQDTTLWIGTEFPAIVSKTTNAKFFLVRGTTRDSVAETEFYINANYVPKFIEKMKSIGAVAISGLKTPYNCEDPYPVANLSELPIESLNHEIFGRGVAVFTKSTERTEEFKETTMSFIIPERENYDLRDASLQKINLEITGYYRAYYQDRGDPIGYFKKYFFNNIFRDTSDSTSLFTLELGDFAIFSQSEPLLIDYSSALLVIRSSFLKFAADFQRYYNSFLVIIQPDVAIENFKKEFYSLQEFSEELPEIAVVDLSHYTTSSTEQFKTCPDYNLPDSVLIRGLTFLQKDGIAEEWHGRDISKISPATIVMRIGEMCQKDNPDAFYFRNINYVVNKKCLECALLSKNFHGLYPSYDLLFRDRNNREYGLTWKMSEWDVEQILNEIERKTGKNGFADGIKLALEVSGGVANFESFLGSEEEKNE